jgi:AmmeMemoRadiSam system protein A
VLSDEDKRALLDLARRSVRAAVLRDPLPEFDDPPGPLAEMGAAFVTLRKAGDLRGCIGHVEAREPLWRSVRDMAASSATRDPRFPVVRAEELPDLFFEISVLSAMSPIRLEQVVIGRHGLYVRSGQKAGLLLPQVAAEHGWNPEEFLRHTFEKAGLPRDASPVEVLAFTAQHFP